MLSPIESISLRLSEPSDIYNLPAYDYTKLTAILTCPTWGIIRYSLHKTMSSGERQLALETGELLHHFFAACRLIDAYRELSPDHTRDHIIEKEGQRLYGTELWDSAYPLLTNKREDDRTSALQFGLHILNNCGYYDDPSDRRRTLSNIEECAIAYYDAWHVNRGKNSRIWVDHDSARLGVEVPFDITVQVLSRDGIEVKFRYTGKMDGIHELPDGSIVVHENKTGSRIDNAWSSGMLMSHQLTGYALASRLITGKEPKNVVAHGLQVPLPRSSYSNDKGVIAESFDRTNTHFETWLNWVLTAITADIDYRSAPFNAPRYTHSCNRYFRACPFIPLCDSRDREEFDSVLDEMAIDEWSPLHD